MTAPSRRKALAALVGLGAAIGLPRVTSAATGSVHPDAALIALQPRIAAVNAALDAACHRLGKAELLHYARQPSPDHEAAEANEDVAYKAWADLRKELANTPATTLLGLRIKVQSGPDMHEDGPMMESVIQDILAMSGGTI